MKYRAEIDGLRALAVVPVILFHAGFELFSGGFVGVDVFFVISGYLITTILIEDIENDRFSIVNFYERRARRILPALFFVMLVCIPFAWMWMLPSQMKDFSQSLIAVSFFSSNILFWHESGYFDTAAEEKPLLHTWSLAVEEQYYVLFPVFLFLAWRFGKNRVFWMIVVFAAISLALSEWGWRNSPTANFYLAPTRAWELFAGSIAAFTVQRRGVQANNALSLIGLAAIVFAIFAYDESTPFPSVYSFVPVIGVVLLVLYADKDTLGAKLLSTKGFVGIGLISYSAYLWHQPLFVFARIKLVDAPSLVMMCILSVTSFGLAVLSWRFIEQPFRKKIASRRKIFLASVGFGMSFIVVGLAGHFGVLKGSVYQKHHPDIALLGDNDYAGSKFEWIEQAKTPSVLLVGDSHAKQYLGPLRDKLGSVSMFAESACISLPGLINKYKDQTISRSECINLNRRYLNYLEANPTIDIVFFAHRWGKNLFDLDNGIVLGRIDESEQALERLKEELRDLLTKITNANRKIVIIGNVPSAYVSSTEMKNGYVKCLYRYGKKNCPVQYPQDLREGQLVNYVLTSLADEMANVEFFDPADTLCDDTNCFVLKYDRLIYSDHAHLTHFGASEVVDAMMRYVSKK